MNGVQKAIKIGAICFGIVIIVNIFYACFYGLSFIADISLTSKENTIDFEEVYYNINEIDIDAVVSNITIQSGSQFKVLASGVGEAFSSTVKNGILRIEEKGKFLYWDNWQGNIVVTVPEGVVLDKLSIDTGAGKFLIKGVYADTFDMDHGAGILEIMDCNFMETDIDGGAGEISITSSVLNHLDMDAGVGKVQIEASITGNSEIDCGVGEIDITLLGSVYDYTIQAEKGIGSVQINGETLNSDGIYGSGSNHLKLEGGVGSIFVFLRNLLWNKICYYF